MLAPMALSSTEPELLPIDIFPIPAMRIMRVFAQNVGQYFKNCSHPAKKNSDYADYAETRLLRY